MSQVKFKTKYNGETVEVMAGWDNPLQGFFMTIFGQPTEEDDEPILYNNLADPNAPGAMGFSRDTEYFKHKLEELGIIAPAGFWQLVNRKEGNVHHVITGE